MESLKKSAVLLSGTSAQIRPHLKSLRGRVDRDKLADYIVQARESFPPLLLVLGAILNKRIRVADEGLSPQNISRLCESSSPGELWKSLEEKGLTPEGLRAFAKDIKGVGDKQAGHFLRGLGFENFAILDTHVLDKLVELGCIDEKPKSLTHRRYVQIERKMKRWSQSIGIPFPHLDLLLWEDP